MKNEPMSQPTSINIESEATRGMSAMTSVMAAQCEPYQGRINLVDIGQSSRVMIEIVAQRTSA